MTTAMSQADRIAGMIRNGRSVAWIADAMGISKKVVFDVVSERGLVVTGVDGPPGPRPLPAPTAPTSPPTGRTATSLLDHPDKRVARLAQKTVDANNALREALGVYDAKAQERAAAEQAWIDLQAKRARLEAELADVKRRLQGKTTGPKVKRVMSPAQQEASAKGIARMRYLKQVRQWCREQGIDVADRGRVPQTVIDAYEAAQVEAAS